MTATTTTQENKARPAAFQQLLNRIEEISTLPSVAMRIIEIANDPASSVSDLKRVVEGDPSLTARLLRMVNSAAFGLSTRIDTVHRAISFLGFNRVRNLAVTASIADVFKSVDSVGTYSRRGLWRHMVSTAVISRLIAMRCGQENFETAFLAGLLHDLGIILLDQHLHGPFTQLMAVLSNQRPLVAVEKDLYGFTHAEVGSAIAEKWRFPIEVHDAILFHHNSKDCEGVGRSLSHIVEVANVLCTVKNITSTGIANLPMPPPAVFAFLQLDKNDLRAIFLEIDGELEKNKSLLEI